MSISLRGLPRSLALHPFGVNVVRGARARRTTVFALASSAPAGESSGVVIVGAGPAGLATALLLSQSGAVRGRIWILEKRLTPVSFDPDRAFTYAIDGHGQPVLAAMGLLEGLHAISAPSDNFVVNRVLPSGKVQKLSFDVKGTCWLQRDLLCSLLLDELKRHHPEVEIVLGVKEVRIGRCVEGGNATGPVEVVADRGGSFSELPAFRPALLVGADGVNSCVREALRSWETGSGRFEMTRLPSPSSGLRYKVLTLPPGFSLDTAGKSRAEPQLGYAITGVLTGRLKQVKSSARPSATASRRVPRSVSLLILAARSALCSSGSGCCRFGLRLRIGR